MFRGASLEIEHGTVRFLGPDVAIWRGNIVIRPAGAPAPLRGHSVDVMRRVGDRWLILETHPKVFPPPPRSAGD
jgi:hypothetical protein